VPSYTQFFGLIELGSGDSFSTNSYQFSTTNMVVIDALLAQGAEFHHHDGLSAAQYNPSSAPGLIQSATGGALPAGTTVYYEYTYVNSVGLETAPSPTGTITTPSAIATPAAPSLSPTTGTGSLVAGVYNYVVSGYLNTSTNETLPSTQATTTLSATGEITISWMVPSGATGVNIYRQDPTDTQLLFLTSETASTTSLIDNGTLSPNCDRTPATSNTTNTSSQVTGTIVAPPSDWTANVYRTTTAGAWGGSQIVTGLTGTAFTDTGAATLGATPPTASRVPSDPPKVNLTNGAEVQGILPGSMVDFAQGVSYPYSITFTFPGTLQVTTGVMVWYCPFVSAQIVNVTCALGVSSTPNANPVIADVLLGAGVNPTYTSIFTGGTKPEVPVGQQIGSPQVPITTAIAQGDTFQCSITQTGGGSNTDHDLSVTIYLLITASTALSGYAPGMSGGHAVLVDSMTGVAAGISGGYSTAL
jgi:hypothetical protein